MTTLETLGVTAVAVGGVLCALWMTGYFKLPRHNTRSGGCRYFASSFDSLDQHCIRCEGAPHWLEDKEPIVDCRYCNQRITVFGDDWMHVRGPGSYIRRCLPELTGLPYGVNASPTLSTWAGPA